MPDPDPTCPFPKRFPSQLLRDDAFFMSLAYNQAIDAWRCDEVPIGAVVALDGATLYVTKEPCPMCSGAMLMSRVKRVCFAVPDPKMGCLGGATNLNDLPRVNHHVELTAGGVLEAECRELLQTFFRLKRREDSL